MYLLLAMGLGLLVLVVEGTSLVRTPEVLEAERLVLRDEAGVVRARLGLRDDGSPELALCDARGVDQVTVRAAADDSAVMTFYDRGRARMHLETMADGWANIRMFGDGGESRASMYLTPDHHAGMAFQRGTKGFQMTLGSDGSTRVCVTDENGERRETIGPRLPTTFQL